MLPRNVVLPYSSRLEPETREWMSQESRLLECPFGTVLSGADGEMKGFMTVLEGELRVQHRSPAGRELVLYRLGPGQSCVTFLPLLKEEAEAVVEKHLRAVLLPLSPVRVLQARSPAFRALVQDIFTERLSQVMLLAAELAYVSSEARLAHCLLRRASGGSVVRTTHQALAVELGTAREVVSRLLKDFERKGWVALGRGSIVLEQPTRLAALVANSTAGE